MHLKYKNCLIAIYRDSHLPVNDGQTQRKIVFNGRFIYKRNPDGTNNSKIIGALLWMSSTSVNNK